jgi:Cu(I)/Ag(I) efflux system periplasmic protein CusF
MHKLLINTVLALGFATFGFRADAGQGNRAQDTNTSRQHAQSASMHAPKKPGLNQGVVEEVDNENQSIVIQHGRIKSKTVEMGPMTMPFSVANAALLKGVKVGDRVKFTVENINGMPTLTALKKQR